MNWPTTLLLLVATLSKIQNKTFVILYKEEPRHLGGVLLRVVDQLREVAHAGAFGDRDHQRTRRKDGDRGDVLRQVERQLGQADAVGGGVGEGAQRVAEHGRLLEDLLLHEVAVVALADQRPAQRGLPDRALDRIARGVRHLRTAAVEKGEIALLQILDALGQGRQRQGVRAHEHLVLAIADRERAALARHDQQRTFRGISHHLPVPIALSQRSVVAQDTGQQALAQDTLPDHAGRAEDDHFHPLLIVGVELVVVAEMTR